MGHGSLGYPLIVQCFATPDTHTPAHRHARLSFSVVRRRAWNLYGMANSCKRAWGMNVLRVTCWTFQS